MKLTPAACLATVYHNVVLPRTFSYRQCGLAAWGCVLWFGAWLVVRQQVEAAALDVIRKQLAGSDIQPV